MFKAIFVCKVRLNEPDILQPILYDPVALKIYHGVLTFCCPHCGEPYVRNTHFISTAITYVPSGQLDIHTHCCDVCHTLFYIPVRLNRSVLTLHNPILKENLSRFIEKRNHHAE